MNILKCCLQCHFSMMILGTHISDTLDEWIDMEKSYFGIL